MIAFKRTDPTEDGSEILRFARCADRKTFYSEALGRETAFVVQATRTSGPRNVPYVYTLDGDSIDHWSEWELVPDHEIPQEVIDAIDPGWVFGQTRIERLPAENPS